MLVFDENPDCDEQSQSDERENSVAKILPLVLSQQSLKRKRDSIDFPTPGEDEEDAPTVRSLAMGPGQSRSSSESLIALLGVSVEQLYGVTSFTPLPSISAWYSTPTTEIDEEEAEEIDDEPDLETQELQELLEVWESAETVELPLACKKRVTDLTCAALAVTTDEAITM